MSWNNAKQLPQLSPFLLLSPSLWFHSVPLKRSHGGGSGSSSLAQRAGGPRLPNSTVQRQCWCRRNGTPEMTPLNVPPAGNKLWDLLGNCFTGDRRSDKCAWRIESAQWWIEMGILSSDTEIFFWVKMVNKRVHLPDYILIHLTHFYCRSFKFPLVMSRTYCMVDDLSCLQI